MKAVDVMGFAGSFAAGVDQAGFDIVAKREPAKFKGFGMESTLYNMPWIEGQLANPEDWDLPSEQVELVYGCPPCSGFSQLSHANTLIHGAKVGPDAEINECMVWLVDYAARVKPQVVILESVGVAFKSGREWMEGLWERLVDRSGVDYYLTHVNMNNAWVGGDVIRPRYFMVAHRDPFGVGLEFVAPRSAAEVLADLPAETDDVDLDWGHLNIGTSGVKRFIETMKVLRARDRVWRPGTRLPDNLEGLELDPELLALWRRTDGKISERAEEWFRKRGLPPQAVYSHYFSTDPFSTYRWNPDRPFGVIVAASLDRAIHPVHDRPLTFREAARFMSIPDNWSLRSLVARGAGAELGKAVTSAAGKWIAHWAKMSIEGTPGPFAGEADPGDDAIRVINVQKAADIERLKTSGPPPGTIWDEPTADPNPARWLIDRKERPGSPWPQEEWANEDGRDLPGDATRRGRPANAPKRSSSGAPRATKTPVPATRDESRATRPSPRGRPPGTTNVIARIEPEEMKAFIESVGIDKREAARRMGVSYSRINELTTHSRPKSWLNAERWDEVKEALADGRD